MTDHAHHRPPSQREVNDHFDERAVTWHTEQRHVDNARLAADAITSAIDLDPSWSALEVGSGTGLLSGFLAPHLGPIVLLDPSPGMTQAARSRLTAAGDTQQTPVCLDLTEATPPGAPYDLAYSLLALHHVADTAALLSAVRQVLKPGGWLAILDLASEDGSFHGHDRTDIAHHGFDPTWLLETTEQVGFHEVHVTVAGHLVKGTEDGDRDFPLLMLTARA